MPRVKVATLEVTPRDYVMARVAAAKVILADVGKALDEFLELAVYPDEDPKKGKRREQCLDTALEALGDCSRAVEDAQEAWPQVDTDEAEPWAEAEDDEDGDDEEEEDDDEDDD